uniref:Uncharacterized protein n=1 Tax=Heterorhabditis bacteriophora TaxID=37862 RepID=A0A1I7XA87_HETBA
MVLSSIIAFHRNYGQHTSLESADDERN